MKPISNDFKEALKNIKQIDAIISYADRENTNFIITQNSEMLLTEAQDYLVTESAEIVIDNNGIKNSAIYWNTDVFKSVCKMLDLETSNAIPKGTELNIKVGLLVEGEYEYVDYGKFYTIEEPKYNLDAGTYSTTVYDKMINFNIKAIENPLTFEEGVTYTLKQYLEMICDKCGVLYSFDFTNVVNKNKEVIDGNPYEANKDVTYRDILDDIAECLGTNFIINVNNKITNKEIAMNSQIIIDADILKDTNVYIGEKKNAIDGLQVYDGSTMLNYYGEGNSVFKIKNNNIMNKNSQELMSGVLSMIDSFEYYTYNLETFGILALEPFDCFTVTYNNTNYLLCSFHNDIKLRGGVEEEISYEFKEEDDTNDYSVSNKDDALRNSENDIRDAYIEIDKANGQIVLKANSNGNIVQAELNASAEDGSAFNVKADNINFTGKTFNLTSENVAITSTNFSVDKNGNMNCNNADVRNINIRSGDITIGETTGGRVRIQMNQSSNGINIESSSSQAIYGDNLIHFFNVNNFNPRLWISADNDSYTSINLFSNGYGRASIEADNGSGYLYLTNSSQTNTIVLNGSTGNVRCVSLTQTSLEEDKKNIEKYTGAIQEVLKTDIYKYNFKDEDDKIKKHLGFVIGKSRNYSKEIVAVDDDGNEIGVDNYSMTSLCLQAIKEQQTQIEELKQEIKELKNENR